MSETYKGIERLLSYEKQHGAMYQSPIFYFLINFSGISLMKEVKKIYKNRNVDTKDIVRGLKARGSECTASNI